MRRVMIATPTGGDKITVWYANSLFYTLKACPDDIEIIPVYLAYDALLQRARNDLIAMAVEAGADDLFWIDSDVAWEPDWFFRLLGYPVDVVGMTYPKKSDIEMYPVVVDGGTIPIDQDTGLMKVAGLGCGFLRMSLAAITALWESSEPYHSGGKDARMVFELMVRDGELVGEDVVVCRKLADLGFDVWLDPSATLAHTGSKMWTGNFAEFVTTHSTEVEGI